MRRSGLASHHRPRLKEPSGKHVFDLACNDLGIEHRLAPPRHPQTNGMVERFNGRISELVNQTMPIRLTQVVTELTGLKAKIL